MLTSLTVALIDNASSTDKLAVIRTMLSEQENIDTSMVSMKPHNDDKVKYFMLHIGTFVGRVSYAGIFDSPQKFVKYVEKKILQEMKKQRIIDEKNQGIQFNAPDYSEKTIEKIMEVNSEKELAEIFKGNFTDMETFIRDNRVLYLVENDVKSFLTDVLKTKGKSDFWKK